jgi:hypothetical protein
MGGVWVVRSTTKEIGSFETLAEAMDAASNASATGDGAVDYRGKDLQAV